MEYSRWQKEGVWYGIPAEGAMRVLVDGRNGKPSKMFMRRAQQTDGTHANWLVGELNGVRVYVMEDGTVLLTDCDVNFSKTWYERLLNGEYDALHKQPEPC